MLYVAERAENLWVKLQAENSPVFINHFNFFLSLQLRLEAYRGNAGE